MNWQRFFHCHKASSKYEEPIRIIELTFIIHKKIFHHIEMNIIKYLTCGTKDTIMIKLYTERIQYFCLRLW